MGVDYPVLTFKGDVSDIPSGVLFGWDELVRPYETLDAEFIGGEWGCRSCERTYDHTHVFLQRARADTLKDQGESFLFAMQRRGLL
jgi:hypothetical protein